MSRDTCAFCAIIDGRAPSIDVAPTPHYNVVRFTPLHPVTDGHLLFVPDWHAEHPDALAVAEAMGAAAAYARDWLPNAEFNLITSSGRAATQTIDHVHVHLVPRQPGDGLLLPWSPHP